MSALEYEEELSEESKCVYGGYFHMRATVAKKGQST